MRQREGGGERWERKERIKETNRDREKKENGVEKVFAWSGGYRESLKDTEKNRE